VLERPREENSGKGPGSQKLLKEARCGVKIHQRKESAKRRQFPMKVNEGTDSRDT